MGDKDFFDKNLQVVYDPIGVVGDRTTVLVQVNHLLKISSFKYGSLTLSQDPVRRSHHVPESSLFRHFISVCKIEDQKIPQAKDHIGGKAGGIETCEGTVYQVVNWETKNAKLVTDSWEVFPENSFKGCHLVAQD